LKWCLSATGGASTTHQFISNASILHARATLECGNKKSKSVLLISMGKVTAELQKSLKRLPAILLAAALDMWML